MEKTYKNKMKNKNKLLLSVLFSVVLFMAFIVSVSAVPILATPSSSGTVSGSYVLNSTNGTLVEMLNCTFYAYSPSTANSSYVYIANATNESTSALYVNTTFSSAILEDSNDYSFFASCWNSTTQQNSSASTSVLVNNTVPQTPSSLSPFFLSTDTDGNVTFSATVTGANTTGCTLYFPNRNPGSSSYTMTHSANSCTYTLSSMLDETYDYYIQASDGTNTANSATTRFNVLQGSNSNNYLFQNQEAQKVVAQDKALSISIGDGNFPTGWVLIILFVIVIIFILVRKR